MTRHRRQIKSKSYQSGGVLEVTVFTIGLIAMLLVAILLAVFANQSAKNNGEQVSNSGGAGSQSQSGCLANSTQVIRNNTAILAAISATIPIYKAAASRNALPWEVLAALHYRETNIAGSGPHRSAEGYDEGPFQLHTIAIEIKKHGGSAPIADLHNRVVTQAEIENLTSAADLAAAFFQSKTGNSLTPASSDDQIKHAFHQYNGLGDRRSDDQNAYTMNNFDTNHQHMEIVPGHADARDGAFTVYYLLHYLATYDSSGRITGFKDCSGPTDNGAGPTITGTKACPVAAGSAGWGPVTRSNPHQPTYPGHEGLDILGAEGTNIFAVVGGTVTEAGGSSGSGYRVWVDDKQGHFWFYQHMLPNLEVHKGQNIQAGTLIGHMSNTGAQGRPVHLHLGIAKQNRAPTSGAQIRWDLWYYPFDFVSDIPCLNKNLPK